MNYRFYKYNQIFEYIENINNCSIDTYKIRFSDYSTENYYYYYNLLKIKNII